MAASKYVLEVENVHRIYESAAGYTHAIRGVTLRVERGEFLCVMGPSGSGKSTLMNILGGLDRPTSGTYRLEGISTSDLDDDELAELRARRLGFVFQRYNLLPRATVMRNVMMPLIYTNVPVSERELRAYKALRTVGLPQDFDDHRSNELSGGQMQRVAIARALVNDPALILADEPTGALDSATSELIMDLFSRLADQGKTIIVITHDPETCSWGSRTVHIRDGKLFTEEEERALVEAAMKAGGGVNARRGHT
ncbi:MAG: ABC transporter ATP-binding protein [Atopobiaceae bacterium]|nr:ABC transporter ATP-binding protein [Atopobiaceae bacterium]